MLHAAIKLYTYVATYISDTCYYFYINHDTIDFYCRHKHLEK